MCYALSDKGFLIEGSMDRPDEDAGHDLLGDIILHDARVEGQRWSGAFARAAHIEAGLVYSSKPVCAVRHNQGNLTESHRFFKPYQDPLGNTECSILYIVVSYLIFTLLKFHQLCYQPRSNKTRERTTLNFTTGSILLTQV